MKSLSVGYLHKELRPPVGEKQDDLEKCPALPKAEMGFGDREC